MTVSIYIFSLIENKCIPDLHVANEMSQNNGTYTSVRPRNKRYADVCTTVAVVLAVVEECK